MQTFSFFCYIHFVINSLSPHPDSLYFVLFSTIPTFVCLSSPSAFFATLLNSCPLTLPIDSLPSDLSISVLTDHPKYNFSKPHLATPHKLPFRWCTKPLYTALTPDWHSTIDSYYCDYASSL